MAVKPATAAPKKKIGRPLKEIDWSKIEAMARILCTESEIASVTGYSIDLIGERCLRDHGMNFPDYYKKHSDGGKMSLRRSQFKKAVVDGNPALLIWLGKQMLGQKDQIDMSNTQPIALGYNPNALVKDEDK
jgi:hypothetical protein